MCNRDCALRNFIVKMQFSSPVAKSKVGGGRGGFVKMNVSELNAFKQKGESFNCYVVGRVVGVHPCDNKFGSSSFTYPNHAAQESAVSAVPVPTRASSVSAAAVVASDSHNLKFVLNINFEDGPTANDKAIVKIWDNGGM